MTESELFAKNHVIQGKIQIVTIPRSFGFPSHSKKKGAGEIDEKSRAWSSRNVNFI